MTESSSDPSGHIPSTADGSGLPPVDAVRSEAKHETRTLRCRTVASGRHRQRHHIRHLAPLGTGAGEDDSGSLLNEDDEPHPSEMLLAALGACLTTSIQANAVARSIPLRRLEVHTQGDIDPSALWRIGDRGIRSLGFESIAVDVRIEADAPREALQALVDHAVLWSAVANTLHDPVDIHVHLVEVPPASC